MGAMAERASNDFAPDLTALTKWPAVAVAARHVLRQAASFGFLEPSQVAALDLCTTYASLAAHKGDPVDIRLTGALSELASSVARENDLLLAAASLARLPLSDHPEREYERIYPARSNVPYALSNALRGDIEAALAFGSAEFFARPLLRPDEEIREWMARLASLGSGGFVSRLERQIAGRGIDFGEAEQRIRAWANDNLQYPKQPQQQAARRPAETADSRMLSDDPVDEAGDRLDFKPYANAIARLINNPKTKTPLTLAINAPWGAGKSTLARMIESRLHKLPAFGRTKPHVICWFNAWMHDDAPNLGAAFAAEIARNAGRRRPAWRRLVQPLPSGLLGAEERGKRRTWVLLALLLGLLPFLYALIRGMSTAAGSGNILDPAIAAVNSQSSMLGLILIALVGLSKVWTALSPILNFVSDPAKAAASGSMNKVREQIGMLIRQATSGGNRFIIFVDDIERC